MHQPGSSALNHRLIWHFRKEISHPYGDSTVPNLGLLPAETRVQCLAYPKAKFASSSATSPTCKFEGRRGFRSILPVQWLAASSSGRGRPPDKQRSPIRAGTTCSVRWKGPVSRRRRTELVSNRENSAGQSNLPGPALAWLILSGNARHTPRENCTTRRTNRPADRRFFLRPRSSTV